LTFAGANSACEPDEDAGVGPSRLAVAGLRPADAVGLDLLDGLELVEDEPDGLAAGARDGLRSASLEPWREPEDGLEPTTYRLQGDCSTS
jgi:hypothetical protein